MVLVVGATGLVGGGVVKRLRAAALVRAGAFAGKRSELDGSGATIVEGDLKDPRSLRTACSGIDTVISTASATLSRGAGDNIETVDRDGQLNLIEAAKAAGVTHFIYVSFSGTVDEQFPLRDAKRAVEQRLKESGIPYTIVRPSIFLHGNLAQPDGGFRRGGWPCARVWHRRQTSQHDLRIRRRGVCGGMCRRSGSAQSDH